MRRSECICFGCEHLHLNNDDGLRGGCRAFPDGIPTDEIGNKYSHDKIVEGQVGDYVYTRTKREKNNFGREIWIYQ